MSALVALPAKGSTPLNIIYSLNEELGQLAESLTIFKVDNSLNWFLYFSSSTETPS